MSEHVLFVEDFEGAVDSTGLTDGWWIEGGERVWVEEGRLYVKSDPDQEGAPGSVCTIWNDTLISGDVRVEFDAQVIASSPDVNNINFFLFYSDPGGKSLYETRDSRSSGAYRFYHDLNGYIFTFLNGRNDEGTARIRMRRCPGFELLTETYDYHCRKAVTYHITITRRGGEIRFAVDGKDHLIGRDESPWEFGLLGLRTFRTDLWWDNIRVVQLGD